MNACLLAIALLSQGYSRFQPFWRLLTRPAVQRELRLSASQVAAVHRIEAKAAKQVALYRLEMRRKRVRYRYEDPDFAGPPLEQLGTHLSANQRKRVLEITLQQYGPLAYDAPGVAKELGLSDADRARIGAEVGRIYRDYDLKVERYAQSHTVPNHIVGGDMMVPVETPEIRKLRAERHAKILEAVQFNLSTEQLERLSRLLGKPFAR